MVAMTAQQNQPLTLAQAPLTQADYDRKRDMDDAWRAYRGKFQDPLKIKKNEPNDNVKPNRCAPIVDKGVSFLFGQVLQIQCDEQDFVDGLWGDDDDRMTLLSKIAMNGGIFRQAFVKLIPPAEGQLYPRIVNLNPQNIRIITDPEDCDLHLAYVIEYPSYGGVQKKQIISRVDPDSSLATTGNDDLNDTWTITNYQRRDNSTMQTNWQQIGTPVEWPYPFAPIFTCQNLPNPNEPYGTSDLTPDIVEMNKVYIFTQSNISRILKYHAHPKTWGKGISDTHVQIGIDDILLLHSPDAQLQNLEMTSDLHSSLQFASELRADMDEQSRVPAVALGRQADLPKGNISGVALALLFQPLLEKTTQKQRLYGKLIREVTRAALVLMKKIDVSEYEDYPVTLAWPNLLPMDDLAAAQTALIYEQLGVSQTTLLQRLGFDPDDESDNVAAEAEKKVTAFSRGQGMPPTQQPGQPGQAPMNGGGQE